MFQQPVTLKEYAKAKTFFFFFLLSVVVRNKFPSFKATSPRAVILSVLWIQHIQGVGSWFNPSSHQPPSEIRERSWRVKAGKLVARNEDSLIGKAKAVHISKAKQGINSQLPMGSHPQESRTPSGVKATQEDKCHHSKHLPVSPSPHFIYWAWCHVMEYLFGQFGSPVLAVSPPNLPYNPSPLPLWQ